MESIAVEVNNLSKFFKVSKSKGFSTLFDGFSKKKNDSIKVLDSISFKVNKGEVFGIIGTNGSGKTTLLRIIAGIYKPDIGNVKINGMLSPLMQIGTGFQEEMKAKENIIMSGMLLGMSKKDIISKVDEILKYAEIEKFANMKLKHYSSGMRARLAFATAIQIEPEIFLVDEILSVGDKNFRDKSYKTFLSYKEKKKTILYVTHNFENLSKFCDRAILLNHGKQIMVENPENVISKYNEITKQRT